MSKCPQVEIAELKEEVARLTTLLDEYQRGACDAIYEYTEIVSGKDAEIARLASVATAEMRLREGNFETIERLAAERDKWEDAHSACIEILEDERAELDICRTAAKFQQDTNVSKLAALEVDINCLTAERDRALRNRTLCERAMECERSTAERDDALATVYLLSKYVRHTPRCDTHGGRDCNCGLDAIRAALAKYEDDKQG